MYSPRKIAKGTEIVKQVSERDLYIVGIQESREKKMGEIDENLERMHG